MLSSMHINSGTSPDGKRTTAVQDGKPYIPATLFKGIVRNNFEMFYNTYQKDTICNDKENSNDKHTCNCPSCTMFGRSGFQKSRIIFDNLETTQDTVIEIRANNSINRSLRKTKEGALVFTEVVSPLDKYGNSVVFSGDMLVYYPKDNANTLESYLVQSIRHIVSIGLGKSRGLGYVSVEVNRLEEED